MNDLTGDTFLLDTHSHNLAKYYTYTRGEITTNIDTII